MGGGFFKCARIGLTSVTGEECHVEQKAVFTDCETKRPRRPVYRCTTRRSQGSLKPGAASPWRRVPAALNPPVKKAESQGKLKAQD